MSGSYRDRRERAFALLARLDPQAPTRVAAHHKGRGGRD